MVAAEILPDELDLIAAALRRHAADAGLIVTTGGTGLAARDVTPEATRLVCERMVDGMAERMRAEGLQHTPLAALSRASVRNAWRDADCESAGQSGRGEEFIDCDSACVAACA